MWWFDHSSIPLKMIIIYSTRVNMRIVLVLITVIYFSPLSTLSPLSFYFSKTSPNQTLFFRVDYAIILNINLRLFADGRNDLSQKFPLIDASAKVKRGSRQRRFTEEPHACVQYIRACMLARLLARSRAHALLRRGVNVGAQYESSSIETIGNFRRRISVGSGGSAHGHSLGKLKSRQ